MLFSTSIRQEVGPGIHTEIEQAIRLPEKIPTPTYTHGVIVDSFDVLEFHISQIIQKGVTKVSFDTETNGTVPLMHSICGYCLGYVENEQDEEKDWIRHNLYVPVRHKTGDKNLEPERVRDLVQSCFDSVKMIYCWNAGFEASFFHGEGGTLPMSKVFDGQIVSQFKHSDQSASLKKIANLCLDGSEWKESADLVKGFIRQIESLNKKEYKRRKQSLDSLYDLVPVSLLGPYGGQDADMTYRLGEVLLTWLHKTEKFRSMVGHEHYMLRAFFEAETNHLELDRDLMADQLQKLRGIMDLCRYEFGMEESIQKPANVRSHMNKKGISLTKLKPNLSDSEQVEDSNLERVGRTLPKEKLPILLSYLNFRRYRRIEQRARKVESLAKHSALGFPLSFRNYKYNTPFAHSASSPTAPWAGKRNKAQEELLVPTLRAPKGRRLIRVKWNDLLLFSLAAYCQDRELISVLKRRSEDGMTVHQLIGEAILRRSGQLTRMESPEQRKALGKCLIEGSLLEYKFSGTQLYQEMFWSLAGEIPTMRWNSLVEEFYFLFPGIKKWPNRIRYIVKESNCGDFVTGTGRYMEWSKLTSDFSAKETQVFTEAMVPTHILQATAGDWIKIICGHLYKSRQESWIFQVIQDDMIWFSVPEDNMEASLKELRQLLDESSEHSVFTNLLPLTYELSYTEGRNAEFVPWKQEPSSDENLEIQLPPMQSDA